MRWRDRGACNDADDIDAWWPERGTPNSHGLEAKRTCAGCPVRVPCLVDSLATGERFGIRGGAGGGWRRALRRAFTGVEHDPLEPCEDPGCSWCPTVAAHWERLDTSKWWSAAASMRPVQVFPDPGTVTHARRGTYAKGCRCPGCRWAATRTAQNLARRGVDTAEFWAAHTAGFDVADDAAAAAAREAADVAGEAELGREALHKATAA